MSNTTPEKVRESFKDLFRQTMLEHDWAIDKLSEGDLDALAATAQMLFDRGVTALQAEVEALKVTNKSYDELIDWYKTENNELKAKLKQI